MFITTETEREKFTKVTLTDDYWLKIGSIKEANRAAGKHCLWLHKGKEEDISTVLAMFILEPLEDDLYLMAYGGAGNAVFDSFGSFSDCFERAIATFKNEIAEANG